MRRQINVNKWQRHCVSAKIKTDDQELMGKWLCDKIGGTYVPGTGTYIGLERNGELCAVVGYEDFNGASVRMHVAAAEGKRWMVREYLWFCFYYPFEQLGVKQLIGLVDSSNTRALAFDKHLGFKRVAVIPEACKNGDLVILTMSRSECRFLSIKRP